MNFLGMGPVELVLVAALALIVFGPDKLPDIARQIGRMVGELRRVSSDVTREIQRGIQDEPSGSGPRIVRQSTPSPPQQTPVDAAVPDTPSILPPANAPLPTSASTPGSWEDGATQPTPPSPQDPRRPI